MAVDTAQADINSPFPQGSLEANKAGRVTDLQMQVLRADSRGVRKSELSVAAFSAALGIFLFIAVKPSASPLVKVVVPIGCIALAIFLLWRAVTGEDRLTRDLDDPQVQSLEGGISKYVHHSSGGRGRHSTIHYLRVAGESFTVGSRAYAAAPDAGFVRIFFLPISRHVVNLEHLPDQPLPEGTTPQAMVQDFKQAIMSHDRAQLDTIRAEMEGTGNQIKAAMSVDTTPPPAASLDQRPLAQAIVGTWSNGPIRAEISADGTFAVTMLGANQQSGRWSVGADGNLAVDLGGHGGATQAWVAGDQLTVSLGQQAVILKRESA